MILFKFYLNKKNENDILFTEIYPQNYIIYKRKIISILIV